MSVFAKSITYTQHGEPTDVLQLVEEELQKPKNNQVLVKILAAPINPADIVTIQGKYAVKPKFPAVAGNECVAEVVEVGDKVKNLTKGQHVVPYVPGIGTWRTYAVYDEEQLMPVSDKISLAEAATITVNPCTAYRMLKDFVKLSPGDCVIQNGANSAVGQAVHQLCKVWGYKSIGIVRSRPEIEHLKTYLKSLGATEILTEEEICNTTLFEEGKVPKPKLALNCVGGKSASLISRQLTDRGVMVTYGGMANEPITVDTGDLIFKDVAYRGYWMTRWTKENLQSTERTKMFEELCELMEQHKLVPPIHEMVPVENFKEAAAAALNLKDFTGKKFIFKMQN